MNFWHAVIVALSAGVADIIWAQWSIHTSRLSPARSAIAAIGILLIGIVSIDAYIASRLYVVPAAVGGGIGTYWTVKRERRKRERNNDQ